MLYCDCLCYPNHCIFGMGRGVCTDKLPFFLSVCLFVFKFSLYMVRPLGTIIDPEKEDHILARNPGMGDIMERTL